MVSERPSGARTVRVALDRRIGCELRLAALLSLFLTPPVSAQRLRGVVADEASAAPVSGADVALVGANGQVDGRTLTGAAGEFTLAIPKLGALYRVEVHALGYAPFTGKLFRADSSERASLWVSLMPRPIPLAMIRVQTSEAKRALTSVGFYEREHWGFGYYLGPRRVREEHPVHVTDLLWGIPGVWLVPNGPGMGYVVATRQVTSLRGPAYCPMAVFVDGDYFPQGEGFTLDDIAPAQDVLGVEVYPNQGMGSPVRDICGVVLIWTDEY